MKLHRFFVFAVLIFACSVCSRAGFAQVLTSANDVPIDCGIINTVNLNPCINLGYVAPLATGNIVLNSSNSSTNYPGNFTIGSGNHLLLNGSPVPGDVYVIYNTNYSADHEGRMMIAIDLIVIPALWQASYFNPVNVYSLYPQLTNLKCDGSTCGPGPGSPGTPSLPCQFPAPAYCESGDL